MVDLFENFGLGFLTESENDVYKLISFVSQKGSAIAGYSGNLYFNCSFGSARFIARGLLDAENKRLRLIGLDTHGSGNCVWNCRLSGALLQPPHASLMERRCILGNGKDGTGMAIVNLINADVLPSFIEGDEITLQMIGFPISIGYFPDEEAYAGSVPADENGKKTLLADGVLFPSGFLYNHDPDRTDKEKDDTLDDYMLVRGTVKDICSNKLEYKGTEMPSAFIRCVIDTEYGDLELIHQLRSVDEKQRQYMKPGAVVSSVCILSGDAAINEYQNGAVFDEEHDLRLLRHVLVTDEVSRARYVFSAGGVYFSEITDTKYSGRDAIMDHLGSLHDKTNNRFFAHMATITAADHDEQGNGPKFKDGKRCVVFASGEEKTYKSILFIDVDENGKIVRLLESCDSRYHFRIDQKPVKGMFGNIENVLTPLTMRAKFHGIIDESQTVTDRCGRCREFERNAERMLAALQDDQRKDPEEALANVFGYLFAKELEIYVRDQKQYLRDIAVSYVPADAFAGVICTQLDDGGQKAVQDAMNLGKEFYRDFKLFVAHSNLSYMEINAELIRALSAVQRIGELYAPKAMKKTS